MSTLICHPSVRRVYPTRARAEPLPGEGEGGPGEFYLAAKYPAEELSEKTARRRSACKLRLSARTPPHPRGVHANDTLFRPFLDLT